MEIIFSALMVSFWIGAGCREIALAIRSLK